MAGAKLDPIQEFLTRRHGVGQEGLSGLTHLPGGAAGIFQDKADTKVRFCLPLTSAQHFDGGVVVRDIVTPVLLLWTLPREAGIVASTGHEVGMFLGGPTPQEPFAECGRDPTTDDLSCKSFPACE